MVVVQLLSNMMICKKVSDMKRKENKNLSYFVSTFLLINRTFSDTSDSLQLISLCRDLAKKTVDELISDRILCKRVTLKMKTANFETLTRPKMLSSYTDSLSVITDKAVDLLKHELDQDLELPALRLMGKKQKHCSFLNNLDNISMTFILFTLQIIDFCQLLKCLSV